MKLMFQVVVWFILFFIGMSPQLPHEEPILHYYQRKRDHMKQSREGFFQLRSLVLLVTGSTTFEHVNETLLDYQTLVELLDGNSAQVTSYKLSLAQKYFPKYQFFFPVIFKFVSQSCRSLIECLSSIHYALDSIPTTVRQTNTQ